MAFFEEVECPKCHVLFGLLAHHNETLKRTKESFWCPNGHPQSYRGDTEAERLRKELESTARSLNVVRQQRDSLERDAEFYKRQAASMRGHFNRLKRKCNPEPDEQGGEVESDGREL